MKRLILKIFLIVSLTAAAKSQVVNVTSAFDSTRIYIGDQIKFTITIDKPSNLNLTLPAFKDTLCKNIEILSGPVVDSSAVQNGRIKIIEKYLITSFDSGFYQVPPVFAELKNQSGIKRFYSDYSKLEVMRVNIAPADTASRIFDIVSPYKAPITIGEILPWVLIIALLAVILWAGIRYLHNLRKTKEGIVVPEYPDPAHVIAFRSLEKLRDEELWQKGEIKLYYTRLTEILRQYLENRFRVYSLEMTTSETLEALVKTGFKKDASYKQLKEILSDADLVKFAKYNPEPSENENNFKHSWDFVETTREIEATTAETVKKVVEERV